MEWGRQRSQHSELEPQQAHAWLCGLGQVTPLVEPRLP